MVDNDREGTELNRSQLLFLHGVGVGDGGGGGGVI